MYSENKIIKEKIIMPQKYNLENTQIGKLTVKSLVPVNERPS